MDSSEINQAAERALCGALPPSWIAVPQHPDEEHIDFKIQIKELGQATGLDFSVQLKGVMKPKFGKRGLSYKFKCAHLEYWIDKHRRPVFVIVVDVKDNQCYWGDVQDWDRRTASGWRTNRTSAVIHIPKLNRVDDTERFLKAIRAADVAIRERWPGSVHAAATQEVARLKEIDDRFDYEHRHLGDTTTVVVHPTSPMRSGIRGIGDVAITKLEKMMGTGQATCFAPGEIRFTGSGLFDLESTAAAERSVILQVAQRVPFDLWLSTSDASGSQTATIPRMRGTMMGGFAEKCFEATLDRGAIKVSGRVRVDDRGIALGYEVQFDAGVWTDRRLSALTYLDRIAKLFDCLREGHALSVHIEVEAVEASNPVAEEVWQPLLKNVGPRVAFLRKVRAVAEHLGVDPDLPDLDALSQEEIDDVLVAWEAMTKGEAQRPGKDYSCSGTITADVNREAMEHSAPKDLEGLWFRVDSEGPASLFGATSTKVEVVREFQGLRLDQQSAALLSEALKRNTFPIRVTMAGSDESEIRTRFVGGEVATPFKPGASG